MKPEITVVACHPGKPAIITSISSSLESMQQFVGGTIQAIYPFEEPVCIVCNDDGKYMRLGLNRGLRTPDGQLYDIIAGPFFICDCSGEDFSSLTHEQQEKYLKMYKEPEIFVKAGNEIVAVKLPAQEQKKSHKPSHRR